MSFELIETNKLGGKWQQQFLVSRDKFIYLRIVGDGTNFRVMTATANEAGGELTVYKDKNHLWEAASQLARAHDCQEVGSEDKNGRVYIRMFEISQDKGTSDETFTNEVYALIYEFFVILDALYTSSE